VQLAARRAIFECCIRHICVWPTHFHVGHTPFHKENTLDKTHLATLGDLIPDYAKDLRLNLSSMLQESILTPQQLYGTLVATAHASNNTDVIAAAEADAISVLSGEAFTAAKASASIMAMNNIYYRFVHLSANKDYGTMPAKLRMNVIGRPGIDKADFELFSLAVSAINGCGLCIDSHEKVLRDHGMSVEVIHTAVRVAAVMHGVARTLDAIPAKV
jgi:lipoyl-dependent peroxiredoxin subunit D